MTRLTGSPSGCSSNPAAAAARACAPRDATRGSLPIWCCCYWLLPAYEIDVLPRAPPSRRRTRRCADRSLTRSRSANPLFALPRSTAAAGMGAGHQQQGTAHCTTLRRCACLQRASAARASADAQNACVLPTTTFAAGSFFTTCFAQVVIYYVVSRSVCAAAEVLCTQTANKTAERKKRLDKQRIRSIRGLYIAIIM